MDGQPPARRFRSGGLLVGVIVLVFLLAIAFGMLSEREDAQNIPPEERPVGETTR
ncbi:MAG TPA: hypothetical protein VGR37_22570 [Longimicrobiaceae bacterium]|nr:hypothetical protein [Longimicrobiaceae bacterium]